MRLTSGDRVRHIRLPAIDGLIFDTESLLGKPFMLSFLRFASCPFCNLRIRELVTRYDELGCDFSIVAVFDSPLDNLMRHVQRHRAPFSILADADNAYYRAYGIEHSIVGTLKGIFLRMPTMLNGMLAGYLPTTLKGSLTTMPADFLIDREGVIQVTHYGTDDGDHLPFHTMKEFSHR